MDNVHVSIIPLERPEGLRDDKEGPFPSKALCSHSRSCSGLWRWDDVLLRTGPRIFSPTLDTMQSPFIYLENVGGVSQWRASFEI